MRAVGHRGDLYEIELRPLRNGVLGDHVPVEAHIMVHDARQLAQPDVDLDHPRRPVHPGVAQHDLCDALRHSQLVHVFTPSVVIRKHRP